MTQIHIKRVYEDPSGNDGYRVLVDRLWPRGMKKEYLKYDLWAKSLAPSSSLRTWFHEDRVGRWEAFVSLYRKELDEREETTVFIENIRKHPVVTLLYAAKDPVHNHAGILQQYIEEKL